MVKRIDKKTREEDIKKHYHKDISSEDEWSHITGIDPKKQETQDPMEPQPRIITFTNKFSNLTNEELVREKSEKLKFQVNNTDQYLRFVNGIIKERMSKLKQYKDDDQRFQDEVNLLQNKIKSLYDLEKLNPKYLTSNEARGVISYLEDEYERMKDRLLYQELIVQKTKDEIAAKRKQIQQIKDELKDILHKKPQEEIEDPVQVLKEELRKAGIDESSRIFQVLNQIADYLNSKKI